MEGLSREHSPNSEGLLLVARIRSGARNERGDLDKAPLPGSRDIKRAGDANAQVVEPRVGGVPVAVSRAEGGRSVAPGTAAPDAVLAFATVIGQPWRAVRWRPFIIAMLAVLGPCPDVAYHVVETEFVGRK